MSLCEVQKNAMTQWSKVVRFFKILILNCFDYDYNYCFQFYYFLFNLFYF